MLSDGMSACIANTSLSYTIPIISDRDGHFIIASLK